MKQLVIITSILLLALSYADNACAATASDAGKAPSDENRRASNHSGSTVTAGSLSSDETTVTIESAGGAGGSSAHTPTSSESDRPFASVLSEGDDILTRAEKEFLSTITLKELKKMDPVYAKPLPASQKETMLKDVIEGNMASDTALSNIYRDASNKKAFFAYCLWSAFKTLKAKQTNCGSAATTLGLYYATPNVPGCEAFLKSGKAAGRNTFWFKIVQKDPTYEYQEVISIWLGEIEQPRGYYDPTHPDYDPPYGKR